MRYSLVAGKKVVIDMQIRRTFTREEDAYIRANFGILKRKVMAEQLNITSKQLGAHMVALGLYLVKEDVKVELKRVWKPKATQVNSATMRYQWD